MQLPVITAEYRLVRQEHFRPTKDMRSRCRAYTQYPTGFVKSRGERWSKVRWVGLLEHQPCKTRLLQRSESSAAGDVGRLWFERGREARATSDWWKRVASRAGWPALPTWRSTGEQGRGEGREAVACGSAVLPMDGASVSTYRYKVVGAVKRAGMQPWKEASPSCITNVHR